MRINSPVRSNEELDEAVTKDSRSGLSRKMRCISLITRGRLADAANDCSEALKIDPRDTSALTFRCLAAGLSSSQTRDCDEAIRIDSNAALPYAIRALFRLKSNKDDIGLADAEHAVQISDKDAFAQVVLGLAQLANRNYRSAREAGDASIKLNPAQPLAYLVRAAANFPLDNRVAALSDLADMRARSRGMKLMFYAAGDLELKAADFRDAAEDLGEAVRLGMDGGQILMECGIANVRVGNVEQALQLFDRAVLEMPEAPLPYLLRGELRRRTNHKLEADADFTKAKLLSEQREAPKR